MASPSIDTAFIRQFESDVHVAYQRFGTKLRNTIRRKVQVNGEDVRFQKYGTGVAGTKSRHGDVPVMNVSHTNVDCTLTDHYAAEYIDELDLLKTNIDERSLAAQAGAAALGRKTDSLITTAMDATTSTIAHGSAGLTKAKVYEAFETLGGNDVPDDGQRFWVVSHAGWTDLLDITEFASSDYIGSDSLPFNGMTAKRWMGFLFFTFSGLDVASNIRKTFCYHTTSMGHGIGKDVSQDITWDGRKQAHLVVNKMSQGSVLVDANGIIEVSIDES
ncbi:MAG: phage capsid protein [Candidatus Thalassarchaeaceae archaeon]